MARKIIWSEQALDERKSILEYWAKRNKSKSYSKKLYDKFNDYLELIIEYPFFGRTTQVENIRLKIVDQNYSIIYSFSDSEVYVISIWDNRRNPKKQTVAKK